VAIDEIVRLAATEDRLGHHLTLRDGSRVFAFVGADSIPVKTAAFGPKEFPPIRIRSLTATQPAAADADPIASLTSPYLLLAGENLLVGQIDLAELQFVASGQKVPVPPGQVRHLRVSDQQPESVVDAGPVFDAELWDGGTLQGHLNQKLLPVRSGEQVVQVAIRDLLEVHVPAPAVPDAVRVKITQLVRDLGDPQYAKRKAASAALGELKYMARPQLEEAAKQSADPEVRRSAQALLEELKE
jgi:hypothetical protein